MAGLEVNVISNTIQEFKGTRYYLCGHYYQHKGIRLHRAVWEAYNGPIPEGYHVHHINEDKSDNNINNLSLMPGIEHINMHGKSEERRENGRRAIKMAILVAPEWHRSEEGRAWHKEHGKKCWEDKEPVKRTCDMCGREYETMHRASKGNHFCSNNCKSEYRRKNGADDIEVICPVCGAFFKKNKYSRKKNCSKECALIARWGERK